MSDQERIEEVRRVTRVNSKGEKRRKLKCGKGYKLAPSGKSCVPITGSEKAQKRKSIRRALRTKKSKGKAYQKRVNRKRLKALKKRRNYGL